VPETQVAHQELVEEYTRTRPGSRAAFERASRVLPGGLTHDVRAFTPFLPYIARAAGARKWDVDGHAYLDYAMGHGALILGHAHPAVVEAVARQVALGTHPGANHLLEIEWAERIRALVPGAELVRFTSSGTEATMLALRVARAATGRPKVVKFQGHFHGWHDAVVPGQSPPWEELPPGVPPSVARETVVLPADLAQLERALRGDPEIGAAIVEPSGASWGTVPLPPGFLAGVRSLTAQHRACFIIDEVITGFRWAPGGAQQRYGVQADLVAMAKIVAGGLPGGAVAGRRELLEPIGLPGGSRRKIHHPGTFNANPLSAAAGIACLDLVRDPAVQDRCDRLAAALRQGVNEVLRRRGVRGFAYGEASVFHLAFGPDLAPGEPRSLNALAPEDLKEQRHVPLFGALSLAMLLEGVHIFGLGGFLSAAHTDADVAETVEAFDRAVRRIEDLLPR
jgi:glutamate-1-semialdehyde 2,1-aminomutase